MVVVVVVCCLFLVAVVVRCLLLVVSVCCLLLAACCSFVICRLMFVVHSITTEQNRVDCCLLFVKDNMIKTLFLKHKNSATLKIM